jgi:hypothetical protein
VALQTALGGPHQRGRIYVPAVGASMFSPHVLATSQADAAANSTATLITAINASTFAASAVSVIVAGSISLPGDVIQVKCDNEMDIQRRRADKLVATYSKVTTV